MSDAALESVARDLEAKVDHWRAIQHDRAEQAADSDSLVSERYNQGQAYIVALLANELEQYIEEELTPPEDYPDA